MNDLSGLTIQPFRPEDQEAARDLILSGLGEHWGTIDPTKNPDLADISASYSGAYFLVARCGGTIAGTGALIPRENGIAEIVRMSVSAEMRRRGLGRMILGRLVDRARELGCRRVILETTAAWHEVIAFYEKNGFHVTHFSDGDIYFGLDLAG